MIGRRKYNTNKNSKLVVQAGHRPDGEDTKKDTQRSRGALATWKPTDVGFYGIKYLNQQQEISLDAKY